MRKPALPWTALLVCIGCGGGALPAEEARSVEADFVGGWDAKGSRGSVVMLLRDGLVGTLSGAEVEGSDAEFRIVFNVDGEVLDEASVALSLSCAEARMRPFHAPSAAAEPGGGTDATHADAQSPAGRTDGWESLDCAGWELVLECGLAGRCSTGDCNMVCDVVYFGDAYALAHVHLAAVEDELDYWQRV